MRKNVRKDAIKRVSVKDNESQINPSTHFDEAQSKSSPHHLPEKWEVKHFEEVCKLIGGSQPSKDEFIYEPKKGYIRLIQVRDYRTDKYITYIPKEKAKRFCNKDDIMIGRYGPPIFGIFKGLEGAYNVALMKAKINEKICDRNYFFKFLQTDKLREFVEHSSKRAAGQDGVRKELLDKYPVPLPPLPDQKRIVAILDTAFAAIDKAKANAQKNLSNARELFDSYLNGVFSNPGEDWEEKTLGEIGNPKMCKRIFKDQTKSMGEIPFYKIGTFGNKPDAYISKEIYNEFKEKYSFPKKGDILISAAGTIGRRVRYDGEPAYFQDSNIVWIDNDEKQILNDFLFEFYGACNWSSTKGATISRLYNDNLKSIKVTFPKSYEEQQKIIHKIHALRNETQKLEIIYRHKITLLDELKKSVLQKTFAGEL
jgi:type I restriction enzyme S subunit